MAYTTKMFFSVQTLGLICGAIFATACKTNLDYLSNGTPQGGNSAVAGIGGKSAAATSSGSGGEVEQGGTTMQLAASGEAGFDGTSMVLLDIVSADGRIVADANSFGIDGEWRKFGAAPELISTAFTKDKVCLQGKVLASDWGGGLQLVLHNGAPAAPALAYDATEHGLGGLQLEIEGSDVPSKIRVKFKEVGTTEDYCRDMPTASGDTLRLLTADALRDCWMSGGAPVDATQLENFEMHIVPEAGEDISFNFCVTKVAVVPL